MFFAFYTDTTRGRPHFQTAYKDPLFPPQKEAISRRNPASHITRSVISSDTRAARRRTKGTCLARRSLIEIPMQTSVLSLSPET